MERDTQVTIAEARDTMRESPALAIQSLKLKLEAVRRAPELVASVRAGLEDKLQSALREAYRQQTIKEALDQERRENLAAAEERRLLADRMARDRVKTAQLLERFNALIAEGNFEDATKLTEDLGEGDTTGVIPVVARVWGEHKRYHEFNQELRYRRAALFLETMAQVELSAMPFPDDTPMVFPGRGRVA